MLAVGIGLRNFAEGLAVGQSMAALVGPGGWLVLGLALHSLLYGAAVAAPVAGEPMPISRLVLLGACAAGPSLFGAVVGTTWVGPGLELLVLSVSAGALVYVLRELLRAPLGGSRRSPRCGPWPWACWRVWARRCWSTPDATSYELRATKKVRNFLDSESLQRRTIVAVSVSPGPFQWCAIRRPGRRSRVCRCRGSTGPRSAGACGDPSSTCRRMQAGAGWTIGLQIGRDAVEDLRASKRRIRFARSKSACVEWAGDELPEGQELLELGYRRVVVVRSRVVHVGRHPDEIVAGVRMNASSSANSNSRPAGAPGPLAHASNAGTPSRTVPDQQAQRHVAGDNLPRRARRQESLLEPIELRRPQHARLGPRRRLPIRSVGGSITALVKTMTSASGPYS